MEVERIKVAVVGCGAISDIYMHNLKERFQILELKACTDLDEQRMRQHAEKYHIKAMTYQEMLEDPEIEIIINLTNPKAHYSISREALEHKKHVFSEKMIAVELEQGRELCRLASENGVRLGAAPDTFLGGSIQTARYIVEKGLIGNVLSAVVSLNRNYDIFGDILPHLHKKGGNIPFDCGCYYMTALASIIGPAKRVCGFSGLHNPVRVNRRIGSPMFGAQVSVDAENIITAAVEYKNGILAAVHMNSESLLDERSCLELYGTEGILIMGDPNRFDSPVYVKKMCGETISFPFTHGYTENSRGLGAAEMAWAIHKNRPHRASMEMAYHVFELIHGMMLSAKTHEIYQLESDFEIPEPLPTGYIDNGFWGPTEESAFVKSYNSENREGARCH